MSERSLPKSWSAGESVGLGDTGVLDASEVLERSKPIPPESQPGGKPVPPASKWRRWSRSWVFWVLLGGITSTGAGLIAVALMLKLPALPNCPAIFWPMASASMRLYCAQVAANKQTVDDLLQAIALVQALPPDHPLRSEINRELQQWSFEILDLGDQEFQAGKLEEAIAIAHQIPSDVPAAQAVKKRIESWQAIWSEAEGIYRDAQAEIHQQHWHQAFSAAVHLLSVDNKYWATTKYDELNSRIETARADSRILAKAQSQAKAGGLDNLLAAIKAVESIGVDSEFYQDAQAAIPEFSRQLLDLAQENLDRHDADSAIKIASSIPESAKLQAEVQDFITLASASRNAWADTATGLQSAIAQAQNLGPDRPLYGKAQELIHHWQLQIGDVAHLEKAREIAQGGTIKDLRAAMTEAAQVLEQNPDAPERNREVAGWRGQIETVEDRPILERAEQKASAGDINSLQAGIDEASQIASGRALYSEAQKKINSWTQDIQRIEDKPQLDRARSLASSGDLPGAISTAQQIVSGRALSGEAQAAVDDWQGQIQARENWRQARRLAEQGTPEALVEAIQMANRVPSSSPWRSDVDSAIEQWSSQVLSIAQARGQSDLPGAIAIAKRIPSGTNSYKAAREQIQMWQKILNPAPNPATKPSTPTSTPPNF